MVIARDVEATKSLVCDLHTHTLYSPDCLTTLAGFLDACRRKGLDRVAVTDHDTVTGALMTELRSGSRQSKMLYSEAIITDGNWHRVGFTWNGSNRRLYVDDILVAEDTDVALAACNGGLNIGCGKSAALDRFFTGLIDDVRIYNRVVKP